MVVEALAVTVTPGAIPTSTLSATMSADRPIHARVVSSSTLTTAEPATAAVPAPPPAAAIEMMSSLDVAATDTPGLPPTVMSASSSM